MHINSNPILDQALHYACAAKAPRSLERKQQSEAERRVAVAAAAGHRERL